MKSSEIPEPVRDLLAAVLEAIDLPHPATFSGSEVHDRLLAERVVYARLALRSALGDDALGPDMGPAWDAKFLRERLAKHPITGYVTVNQATAALDAGATWTEAVTLPTAPADTRDACGRCRKPFNEADTRFDGQARHSNTRWCRNCIDNCREGSAEHACVICDPQRYGGEAR